jgi:hypothetical protein
MGAIMSNFLRATAVAISLSAAGCAIHPLPNDVTGVSTHEIVKRIRCEARDAVRDILIEHLRNPTDLANAEMSRRLADAIVNKTLPLYKVDYKIFKGRAQELVAAFQNTAIAYTFTFDMTELNNFDPTINLIRPFNNGTGTAAIGANFDRSRQNIRTFTISDTFVDLFRNLRDNYCNESPPPGRDYIYPVTGNIGLKEMIQTFVDLSISDNLSAKDGPPTLGDTLRFATTISGSVAPKVVLTPIGTSLQLADASFLAIASRADVHSVVVSLAYKPIKLRSAAGVGLVRGLLVSAKGGNDAQNAAVNSNEQMLLRFELGQRNSVLPIPVR